MAQVGGFAGAARAGLAALAGVLALAATSQPSAAQEGAASAAGGDAAKLQKGRELFDNYACGSCHSLGDAGATGHVGPSFDGDSNLTEPFVVSRVTSGQNAMPAFGGQMSPDEIAAVAAYVVHARGK
jgi:mono/diheme cytochrome c family protein